MARHLTLAAAGAAAALLGWPGQVMATATPTHAASAAWQLADGKNTRVSVNTSRIDNRSTMSLFVSQEYCDAATDTLVYRSFSASTSLTQKQYQVLSKMKGANLAVTTPVSGTQMRIPNCAAPDHAAATTSSLGSAATAIAVTWTGVGSTYIVQPGVTGRAATATGSITGGALSPLNLGVLGTSQSAELRSIG